MPDILQECGDEAYQIGLNANSGQDYALAVSATLNIFSGAIFQVVDNLRTEVAHAGAGIAITLDNGFDEMYQRAKGEFQGVLIRTLGYRAKKNAYKDALANLKLNYPDIDEEKIKNPPRNIQQDWVILFAIFLVGLFFEGIIGAFLLGEVLVGGLVAGMGFAIAISLINILGLGMGMGAVFDHMHRKKVISVLWFAPWLILVLVINGGIAWYRYAQVSTFKEGGIDPVLAMFLFALLGVVFACFAFWRIYIRWYPESQLHKQWKSINDELQSYHPEVDKIFAQFKSDSDNRCQDIKDFYKKLRELLLGADAQWEILKVNYATVREIIEGKFVEGYIATGRPPPKLDGNIPKWEDFTSGFQSRDEAREILKKWDSNDRKLFVDRHQKMLEDLNKASKETHLQIRRNTGEESEEAHRQISRNTDIACEDALSDNNQQA